MSDIYRIGVISDTHIPRRVARVPEAGLYLFEREEVSAPARYVGRYGAEGSTPHRARR